MADKMIKRDIECNARKIEEIKQEFKEREPAKKTYEFINKVDIAMALYQEDLKNLREQNATEHKDIMDRLKRLEGFILALLVLFALAAVYFIFTKTGLKL